MLIRSISGLRGTVGTNDQQGLNAEVVARYASSFATYHGNKGTVAIGYDGRLGGLLFYQVAIDALLMSGCDVLGLGVVPTPTVAMATEHGADVVGGIIITASHNPSQWNGMKFLATDGLFLDAAENQALWDIVDGGTAKTVSVEEFGELRGGDEIIESHLQAILNIPFVDREAIARRKFRVVLDAVNASGSKIHPKLLRMLGVTDIVELYCDGSGIFPHTPEPIPQNLTSLKEAILREKADLGIVVDPDADRLVLIMENGEPFIEENTIALATEQVLKNSQRGQKVVVNLSTTRSIEDIAHHWGATVVRTPVGEINVAKKMREVGAIIGGEGSGGVILPSVHLGRDSMVGVALALSALAEFDGPISQKRQALPRYEIEKSKIELTSQEQVRSILGKLEDIFSQRAERVNTDDGLRLDFERSWLHARASNTEPIIRLIAEAPSREEAQAILADAQAAL